MVMPANATIKHCYSALILLYRAFVHLCTMASGSCAEPGGRPKSSGVWNHFRHDKIKDKSVCTVKSTDGLICGI